MKRLLAMVLLSVSFVHVAFAEVKTGQVRQVSGSGATQCEYARKNLKNNTAIVHAPVKSQGSGSMRAS